MLNIRRRLRTLRNLPHLKSLPGCAALGGVLRSGRLPPLRGDGGTGGDAVVGSPAFPRRGPTATHKHGDRSHDGKGHPSLDEARHLAVGTVPLTGEDGREPLLSSPCFLPSHTVHRISHGGEMSPALPAGRE